MSAKKQAQNKTSGSAVKKAPAKKAPAKKAPAKKTEAKKAPAKKAAVKKTEAKKAPAKKASAKKPTPSASVDEPIEGASSPQPVRAEIPEVPSIAFVSAGPGEPDLIAHRGAKLLTEATMVLADKGAVPVAEAFVDPQIVAVVDVEGSRNAADRIKPAIASRNTGGG